MSETYQDTRNKAWHKKLGRRGRLPGSKNMDVLSHCQNQLYDEGDLVI